MLNAVLGILGGLAVLVWSADRFVDGAAATARILGVPALIIGMVIIGFGTSAPEMVVSALAAAQGNPGLALGNGYGSNIANIALILGLTAVLSPIAVHSNIIRKELPLLLGITLISGALLLDQQISRTDAWLLLGMFALIMGWTIFHGLTSRGRDRLDQESSDNAMKHDMPLGKAVFWLVAGLALLVVSSRILVWGATSIAAALGVNDLIVGLTVVAIGTSLPELAASIAAVRQNEHDLALGNVVGSNMFNTLAVVGIAGSIRPFDTPAEALTRDWVVMLVLTVALFLCCYGFRGRPGRINRREGTGLLIAWIAYTGYLVWQVIKTKTY
jgi:cation:H+ antiporter